MADLNSAKSAADSALSKLTDLGGNTGFDFGSVFDGTELTDKAKSLSKSIGDTVGDLKNQSVNAVSLGSDTLRSGVSYVNKSVKSFQSTVSAFKSEALGQISNVLSALTGGFVDINSIGDLVAYQDGKLTFNTDSLFNSLTNELGFDVRNMDTLARDIQNTLNREFNSLVGDGFGGLFNLEGDLLSFGNKNWRDDEIQNLISVIDRTSDSTTSIYGNASDAALNGAFNDALLEQVVNNGMTDAYAEIYKRYPSEPEAQAAVVKAIGFAIDTGDYHSLDALNELLKPETRLTVKMTYPTLGKRFISAYTLGLDDNERDYDALVVGIKRVLADLAGNTWWVSKTEYGNLLDFTLAENMSTDAAKILILDEDLGVLVPSIGLFQEQSAFDSFIETFPDAVVL